MFVKQAPLESSASARETFGRWIGNGMSPVTAFVSRVRGARMFHPDGLVYVARVEPAGAADDLDALGIRLAGSAIVRLSSAWWRGEKEWPDVLGMALRFLRATKNLGTKPHPDDQDLLLATIRFPWTTPFAPLATNVSSFLWNHFHAVSPFTVDGVGRVKFRARSPRIVNRNGLSRAQHLAQAASVGDAIYELEVRRLELPLHRRSWERVARITLEKPLEIDQAALRFSPFLNGRGLRPAGLVHHLRIGTYASSQAARPANEPDSASVHGSRNV